MRAGESDSRVQALPTGISGRMPSGLNHILKRNNYPDTVLNCAVSYALEAGLPFISNTCFPCDPQGVTCITLHFFTNFKEMFTSDTKNGQKRNFSARPYFKEDANVPALKRALATLRPGNACEDSAGGLFWRLHKNQFRYR
jgi:hypothetical protein